MLIHRGDWATAMRQRSVVQLIKRQAIHLAPSASVREAAQLMSEKHNGALLVMDEGRLAGIFTERDVLNRVVAVGRDPDSTPLSEVMTRDLVTLGPQTAATLALHVMGEVGFRHLPVVENDKVYGIISLRDFVGFELHLAAEAPEVLESN
jgi:CBS domain-containing protein